MNISKNLLLWVIVAVLLALLYETLQTSSTKSVAAPMAYSDFIDRVDGDKVKVATIQGQVITGQLDDGTAFSTYAPLTADPTVNLEKHRVHYSARKPDEESPSLFGIIMSFAPWLMIIAVWFYIMRQMQGGAGGKAMGFGKSKARMLTEKSGRVTFDDVAGIDEAKQELEEVVEFLKDAGKFQRLGGKIPKGVLLVGPPGTGKTLLARAIAGEANVPFFTISGSDFVEMFVGVGASRVRDMFDQGKKNAPCIIFIDEIDAVGRHRGAGLGGGNDEREQTLNQLLVEMDGFEANESVILIAATNRPDVLDPALLRPGRFDRQVVVSNPDVLGREKILKVHTRKIPMGPDVDLKVIARGTPGFSGADLANLTNESALLAARKNKRVVGQSDFEEAKDKVLMGAERRSMVMTEDEKSMTAYHEAGHALITLHFAGVADPIHKATIIPRGRALGLVQSLPERDRYSVSREYLEASLAIAMGGRVAEEVVFGREKVSTGASSDIKMATDRARKMVMEWGMSDKLGPLSYGEPSGEVFLGHSMGTQSKSISEETSREVDTEVRILVDTGYTQARDLITKHRDELETIAQALLEYETLTGEELRGLLRGEPIVRVEEPDANNPPPVMPTATPGDGERRRTSVPTSGIRPSGFPEPQPGA